MAVQLTAVQKSHNSHSLVPPEFCRLYNELSNGKDGERERRKKETRDALSSVIPIALGWAPPAGFPSYMYI